MFLIIKNFKYNYLSYECFIVIDILETPSTPLESSNFGKNARVESVELHYLYKSF